MLSCDSTALHRWKHSPASALDAVACDAVPLRLSRLDLINLSIARPDASVAPIFSLAYGQRDLGRDGIRKEILDVVRGCLVRRLGVAVRCRDEKMRAVFRDKIDEFWAEECCGESCCGCMWYSEAIQKMPSLV